MNHVVVSCVIAVAALLAGCITTQGVTVTGMGVPLKEGIVPPVLLDAGKKLGVDFSDQFFAKQTKCYDNPFEDYYKKNERRFYVICLSDAYPMTRIFWVNKKLSAEDLVFENLNDVLDVRIKNGLADSKTQKKITLLREEDSVLYHKINLDSQYNLVQATFFLSKNKDALVDLNTAIMIRASNLEQAEEVVVKIKKGLVY